MQQDNDLQHTVIRTNDFTRCTNGRFYTGISIKGHPPQTNIQQFIVVS